MGALSVRLAVAGGAMAMMVQSSQVPVFRSRADTVAVIVSVSRGSRPIVDLSSKDFEVLDNGVPQTVVQVDYDSVPIDLTLAVDVSGSVKGSRFDALVRAIERVEATLRPDDTIRRLVFNESIRSATSGLFVSDKPGTRVDVSGETSLRDAISVALIRTPSPTSRQMLLVFTDRADTSSILDASAVREVARASGTAVFAIAVTSPSSKSARVPFLETLAEETGGRVSSIPSDEDLGASFLAAVHDFRSTYVHRYEPNGVALAGWHDLAVRVRRPGTFVVRAKKGYFGGS